jgi:hypothetical protein
MARSSNSLLFAFMRLLRATFGAARRPEGRLFVAVPVLVKPRGATPSERQRVRYEVRDRAP